MGANAMRYQRTALFAAVAWTLAACVSTPLPPAPWHLAPPPDATQAPAVPASTATTGGTSAAPGPPAAVQVELARELSALTPSPGVRVRHERVGEAAPLPGVDAVTVGASEGERPLVMLIVPDPDDARPWSRSLIAVAHELAAGELQSVLSRIDLMIVPPPAVAAAPAQREALRADHLLLLSPRARALADAVRTHAPLVTVFLLERAGGGVEAARPRADDIAEFVSRAANQWLVAAVNEALGRPEKVDVAAPAEDRGLLEAQALKNVVAVGIFASAPDAAESQGSAAAAALRAVIRAAAQHADDLRRVRDYVDRQVVALACRPVEGSATSVTRRPCGYWLAGGAADIAERLRIAGVQVNQMKAPATLLGELTQRDAEAQRLRFVSAAVDMPVGSYHVPLDQPLGNLALRLLDPESGDGYVRRGLLDPSSVARLHDKPPAAREAESTR